MKIIFQLSLFCISPIITQGFSGGFAKNSGSSSNSGKPTYTLSDRFRVSCPADVCSISQYDPSLIDATSSTKSTTILNGGGDGIWAAVYRSSNNLPSVLIKDDFMNAMRIATTVQNPNGSLVESTQIDDGLLSSQIETKTDDNDTTSQSSNLGNSNNGSDTSGSGVKAQTPVAVAKLSPSKDFDGKWTLDSMRCSLKKEDTDESCDGQSEHAEAISICIDELILNHLRSGHKFDKSIRTKATLVSGTLLESRGFKEVDELCKDMATHVSSLDASINKYAERAVETVARSPGARDRALQILAFLGKEDVATEDEDSATIISDDGNDEDSASTYDPWANVGRL